MKEAGKVDATSETQGVLALFFAYIYGDACLDLDFPGFANYFRQHHDDLQSDFTKVVSAVSDIGHLAEMVEKRNKIPKKVFQQFEIGRAIY